MENFIIPEKKIKERKRVVLAPWGATSIPIEYNSWEEYNKFLRSISKINGKPWYCYDFSDLDVINLFENEKKGK